MRNSTLRSPKIEESSALGKYHLKTYLFLKKESLANISLLYFDLFLVLYYL